MRNPWIANIGRALAPFLLIGSFAFAKSSSRTVPFGPGERFEYDLKALGASAGHLKIGVIDQGEYEGKQLMSLAAKLEPTGIATLFWQGESRRTAFLDLASLTPLRVIDVEENKDKIWKTQLDFDGTGNVFVTRFGARRDGKDIVAKRVVPLGTVETLSGLYYLRTRPLYVGEKFEIDLMDNGRMYQVQIHTVRQEKIETVLGKKDVYVLNLEARRVGGKSRKVVKPPVAEVSGSVASASPTVPPSSGEATPTSEPASAPAPKAPDVVASLWMSADAERIPLKFEMQIGKTALSAELTKYSPAP